MQVSLTVIGGVHNGRKIPILVPEFLIGRDQSCHLRPVSKDISRHHCAIVTKRGRVFLRDYGSSNGTILNRRMLVQGELELQDGDVIEVGPLAFKLSLQPDATPPPVAEVESTVLHEDPVAAEEDEPTPEDTVLVPKPKLPPSTQQLDDAGEVLCPD